MVSFTKLKTAVLLASAALLCAAPLAAVRTKPSETRSSTAKVKARTAAPSSRSGATAKASSHKASSHNSGKATTASAQRTSKGKLRTVVAAKPKFRGQQSIDQARTLEIQQALIREHYLDGEASGQWDQATRDALTRLQGDHHWQTKILPDSRALIVLGLGPSHQNLLNPESAAISVPYQVDLEKSSSGGSN
jgi:predicted lipid-binding transport protein (Tim44 family)